MVTTDCDGSFRISFPENLEGGRPKNFVKRVRKGNKRSGGIVLITHADNKWKHAADYQWRESLANGVSEPVKLNKGETGPVTIRLTTAATVSGTVYDTHNRPLANRLVRTTSLNTPYNRYYSPFAITDSAGRFTITYISPGKVTLIASEPFIYTGKNSPYPDKAMVTVEVSGGERVDDIVLCGLSHEEIGPINAKLIKKPSATATHIW